MSPLVLALLSVCPEAAAIDGEARQAAACALVAQEATTAEPDRATLQRLLDDPQFARVRKKTGSMLAVLWDQFWAWVKTFFDTREAATFAKTVPYVVLGLAFAVALLVALRVLASRGRAQTVAGPATTGAGLELKPPPEHLANARRLLAHAPREAAREALLALLSSLERRNFARPDRVKTNRELCRELPKRGAPEALVRDVTARVEWYDRTFYSLAPVPEADAAHFVAAIEALV